MKEQQPQIGKCVIVKVVDDGGEEAVFVQYLGNNKWRYNNQFIDKGIVEEWCDEKAIIRAIKKQEYNELTLLKIVDAIDNCISDNNRDKYITCVANVTNAIRKWIDNVVDINWNGEN